ncbi:MAG: PRK06851 family protein [Firmicutes bacterium]|nr:PRK06851 family protein [Bacillota bacterium]
MDLTSTLNAGEKAAGRVRMVFPGGNTAYGFWSFYDHIAPPDANKIFVIKGGPGVGKSTFMRRVADTMRGAGYDVELHCCSSDNGSLDGVYIPALDVALIDGTAPHVVDPKNPGAVDEIIHLGDYWDEVAMRRHREDILALNREVARLFRRAYAYLAAALIFLKEVESYYQDTGALDRAGLNRVAADLIHGILGSGEPLPRAPRERHLFATAITPEGPVNHLETVVGHLDRRYVLTGDDGTEKTTVIRRVLDAAVMRGYDVEVFHCALDPHNVDHVVIPALGVAVINEVEPHFYQPKDGDRVVDTMQYVDTGIQEAYLGERTRAREMYREAFRQAVWFIDRAKKVHDEMETYYVPNMDFARIEERRRQVEARILELAAEREAVGPGA